MRRGERMLQEGAVGRSQRLNEWILDSFETPRRVGAGVSELKVSFTLQQGSVCTAPLQTTNALSKSRNGSGHSPFYLK